MFILPGVTHFGVGNCKLDDDDDNEDDDDDNNDDDDDVDDGTL
jgi:hypothetical protein